MMTTLDGPTRTMSLCKRKIIKRKAAPLFDNVIRAYFVSLETMEIPREWGWRTVGGVKGGGWAALIYWHWCESDER